jgi:phosphoglycerate dehydrogenase-like enzyme
MRILITDGMEKTGASTREAQDRVGVEIAMNVVEALKAPAREEETLPA